MLRSGIIENKILNDDAGNPIENASGAITSEIIPLVYAEKAFLELAATTAGDVTFQASNSQDNWIDITTIAGGSSLPIGIDLCCTGANYGRIVIASGTDITARLCLKR